MNFCNAAWVGRRWRLLSFDCCRRCSGACAFNPQAFAGRKPLFGPALDLSKFAPHSAALDGHGHASASAGPCDHHWTPIHGTRL